MLIVSLSIHGSAIPIRLTNSLASITRTHSQNFMEHEPIEIYDDDQLASWANSGTGAANTPYIIAGWKITNEGGIGIYITQTTKHFRIENCWIERRNANSLGFGIYLRNVAVGTVTISNNICNEGIVLRDSTSSVIANNTCNNNDNIYGSGIFLQYSGSSTIINNICNNNTYGIQLDNSDSSTIVNNTCNNNQWGGIHILMSSSSTVTNNICYDNLENGIGLQDSDDNVVVWNALVRNSDYGISLSEDSENNAIHHNDFIRNGQDASQASDDGTNNRWYDDTKLEGNYWSDYSGTGSYSIAGTAGTSDVYPSFSPYRYTEIETFESDLLVRISLFLVVSGLLGVVIYINRRKKGFKG